MNTSVTYRALLITIAGYWLLGKAASFFAIPPGFASPIWPAAGFALLMALRGHRWVLPGVWIASFLLNVELGGGSLFAPSKTWLLAAAIGAGAAVQTFVGYQLVVRFTRFPTIANRTHDSIVLGIFAGPVACLLSSGVGVTSLWLSGAMGFEAMPLNWFYWWVGDSIGVLVFAPVILADKLGINWLHRGKAFAFYTVYLLAVLLEIVLFVATRSAQEHKVESLFAERVAALHALLDKQLLNVSHAANNVSALFSTFSRVDHAQFSRYAGGLSRISHGTAAVSWVSRVNASERQRYESDRDLAQLDRLVISERSATGQLVPAADRPLYFPVTFVYPLAGNEAALGFDLYSEPARRDAIDSLLTNKTTAVTAPIQLVQGSGSRRAFLLLAPVLDAAGELSSLVSSVYFADELVRAALADDLTRDVAISIVDITDPRQPLPVYEQGRHETSIQHDLVIPFGQRLWQVALSPSRSYVYAYQTMAVWMGLISGFIVVTVIGLFILSIMSRNLLIETEVAEKTRDLNRALDEAKAANSVKSLFLASMSHELRTPLNSIIGFSVRLLKSQEVRDQPKINRALEVIERNGRHLLNLINDILDLSKVEAGKMTLHTEEVSLSLLLDEVLTSLTPIAESKNLTLTGDCAVTGVRADKKRLFQIVLNLVSNAIKYTTQGGVTVSIARQSLQQRPGVAIHVEDTGSGIRPEDLARVFQRYERLDDPFHAGEMGTGLGLALAQELTQLHGGVLSVTSEPGKGSCFTCWLPI